MALSLGSDSYIASLSSEAGNYPRRVQAPLLANVVKGSLQYEWIRDSPKRLPSSSWLDGFGMVPFPELETLR